jgi:hypothetical protein
MNKIFQIIFNLQFAETLEVGPYSQNQQQVIKEEINDIEN